MRIIDYEVIKLSVGELVSSMHVVRLKMRLCTGNEYSELSQDLAVLKSAYNARVRNNAEIKEAELRKQLL